MREGHHLKGFCILVSALVLILSLESCSGCSHRQRKMRERHREHTERHREPTERHGDYCVSGQYTNDRIAEIAEGDDYDMMLDVLFASVTDFRKLKNQYFQGNLSDKEAEQRINEIEEKYKPVMEALSKAENEGALNYKQHKRQLKLLKEYMELMGEIGSRLERDLDRMF